jgi:hypothetical protein
MLRSEDENDQYILPDKFKDRGVPAFPRNVFPRIPFIAALG